jgi:hypothetical protein
MTPKVRCTYCGRSAYRGPHAPDWTTADTIASLRDQDLSTRLQAAGFAPPKSGTPSQGRAPVVAYVDMAMERRSRGMEGW